MAIYGFPRDPIYGSKFVLPSSDPSLPNSVVITAGSNISIDNSQPGLLIINASGGGSNTDPIVVFSSAPDLVNSRQVTAGNNISLNLGIAGQLVINAQATGGGAPTTPTFVTGNAEGSLPNSLVLTPGQGITVTPGTNVITVGLAPAFLSTPFLTLGPVTLLTGERSYQVAGGLAVSDLGPNSTYTVSASGINTATIGCIVDGASSVITPGLIGIFPLDFNGNIENWTILSDTPNSSAVIQIYKSTFSSYPAMTAITGSDIPTLTNGTSAQDTSLTGWTTSFNSGDCFKFVLDSVTNSQYLTITLRVRKTG